MPLVKNVGVNITINLLNEKRSRQYFYPFFPISPLFCPLIFRTFQIILPCLPLDIINSRVVCFVFHHSSFHNCSRRAIVSVFCQKVYTTSLLHYGLPPNQFTQYSIGYYPYKRCLFSILSQFIPWTRWMCNIFGFSAKKSTSLVHLTMTYLLYGVIHRPSSSPQSGLFLSQQTVKWTIWSQWGHE